MLHMVRAALGAKFVQISYAATLELLRRLPGPPRIVE